MTRWLPHSLFLLSLVYYCALSAKRYTWMFVSGDSGDWLAASTMWMVPQPLGSPLYIFLGQLLHLLPGGLPVKMTIVLSCLPSAMTVALVYLIVYRLTRSAASSACASLVLLGAGIFLTQSTILEQYALAAMFLTAAYYFYISGRRTLTTFALGLGTAVHIFLLPVAILWLIVERHNLKAWLRPAAVYIASGVLPYIYVPILMAMHAPPIMAGYLSWSNLTAYMFDTAGDLVGTMALEELPRRIAIIAAIMVSSLGLAVIPLAKIARICLSGRRKEKALETA